MLQRIKAAKRLINRENTKMATKQKVKQFHIPFISSLLLTWILTLLLAGTSGLLVNKLLFPSVKSAVSVTSHQESP